MDESLTARSPRVFRSPFVHQSHHVHARRDVPSEARPRGSHTTEHFVGPREICMRGLRRSRVRSGFDDRRSTGSCSDELDGSVPRSRHAARARTPSSRHVRSLLTCDPRGAANRAWPAPGAIERNDRVMRLRLEALAGIRHDEHSSHGSTARTVQGSTGQGEQGAGSRAHLSK